MKIVFHATDAEDLTVREIEFSATKGLTEFFVRMLRLVSKKAFISSAFIGRAAVE